MIYPVQRMYRGWFRRETDPTFIGMFAGQCSIKSLIDTSPVHPNVQYSLVERLKNKHKRYQILTKIPVYHTTFKNILSKDVK